MGATALQRITQQIAGKLSVHEVRKLATPTTSVWVDLYVRVSSTGGGVGEASPPESLTSPPNNFLIKHSNIMNIYKRIRRFFLFFQ